MLQEEITDDKHSSKYKYKDVGRPHMEPVNAEPGLELQRMLYNSGASKTEKAVSCLDPVFCSLHASLPHGKRKCLYGDGGRGSGPKRRQASKGQRAAE